MEAYIQQLVEWIQTLSPLSIYMIFGMISYLENIVPPIPGDLLVVFGGYLAAEQIVGFVPVLMITTLASVVGFMNMYVVGKYFGDKIEEQRKNFWLMRFFDVKYFDKGKQWMARWGQGVILANRFLAGTRSVISLTAGITNTRVSTTIVSSFVSSVLWNTILLGAGWFVHENWQVIGNYLNIYGWVILGLIVVLAGGRICYKWYIGKPADKHKKFPEKVD